MTANRKAETSTVVRERVIRARETQSARYVEFPEVYSNAMMPSHMVKKICVINEAGKMLLKTAMEKLGPFCPRL
jgi:magnesium chelatase family protein